MRAVTKVITPPAFEPVTLDEAKLWCRIDDDSTAEDADLLWLIQAMREDAENRTGRAFVRRTLRLYLDDWPWDRQYGVKIVLPYAPLLQVGSPPVAVESFKYIDTDGVLQTLAADQYVVHDEYEPGFIIPEWEETWPTIRRVPDAIQITHYAGYANANAIPKSVRQWMQARIATLFEQREQLVINGQVAQIPRDHVDGLLDSLVIGTRLF